MRTPHTHTYTHNTHARTHTHTHTHTATHGKTDLAADSGEFADEHRVCAVELAVVQHVLERDICAPNSKNKRTCNSKRWEGGKEDDTTTCNSDLFNVRRP